MNLILLKKSNRRKYPNYHRSQNHLNFNKTLIKTIKQVAADGEKEIRKKN